MSSKSVLEHFTVPDDFQNGNTFKGKCYAGRTELPDNLKSMFRPIAMVTPDSMLISEITLFGEGFGNCKALAKKTYTLYSLAEQQLSKQDHYDFGLRALVSVLRYAGKKKRNSPNLSDEEVNKFS
ncbi:Hypothetical predicted protein [Mytilus galloprovincialis]|uniref:Dynein heavy chain hydrolytic ATP-binding dynein motor region domain-containing protein n=1 Tax=Mytilus galloprovincialis TaxID=29158 RepID=A0A8B6CNR9_MYTGA|nr:Hypothetical predicted protein [Mytilus galloprovincialis]